MANSARTRQMIRDAVKRHGGGNEKKRSRWVAAGMAALLMTAGLGLWALLAPAPAAVAEIRSLVDEEVARLAKVSRNEIPYSSSGPDMGEWFQKFRDVPEGYRDEVRREMGRLFSARERAATGSYFALPPAQRKAELDRRIKAEDARRQQWMAERAARSQNDRPGNPQTGPNAGPGPGGRPGPGREGGNPGEAQRGGGPQRGPTDQAGRRRGPRTEDSRNEWMKRRIDGSSPEERARQTEYRRAMTERREQLGLSPGRGGPGRRPG